MLSILARMRSDRRGNILVLAAAGMPVFIGAAGLAVDTIIWAQWKREIQRAADSAAIAGALTVQQARYKAEQAAMHDFKKSRAFRVGKANMWFENAPHSGPYHKDNDAVLVRVRLRTSLPFTEFFLNRPFFLETDATATLAKGIENCIIALDESSASAVDFGGSSRIKLNCSIMSNSDHPQSVSASGSSTVIASFVYAVGGISGTSHYRSTKIEPFSPPQIDPFRDLPTPRAPSQCGPQVVQKPTDPKLVLLPGCYSGLDLKAEVELKPGIYYITERDLSIGSGATVKGDGITFILTSNNRSNYVPQFSVSGSPLLDLSAPTDGDYKGVLIYQDPAGTYNRNRPNTLSGSSLSRLQGSLYFPNQPLTFTGDSGANLGCFKMVARTVEFTGNADLSNNCPEGNDRFRSVRVRLVA